MSLMKTLAKVALGVAVARGVGKMAQGGGAARSTQGQSGGGLLGGILDAVGGNAGSGRSSQSGGGLQDLLAGALGGGSSRGGRAQGGLGSILDSLGQSQTSRSRAQQGGLGGLLDALSGGGAAGNARSAQSGGGIGDLLGALTGGGAAGGAAAGGLGGLLGGLLGGNMANQGAQPQNDRSFGEVLNTALTNQDEPDVAPTPEQNAVAGLMLRAMLQAAKSDGKLDAAEKDKLMGNLGDISADEREFIQRELAQPVDVQGLAREVPKGLESQVYTMSLMAIDLDSEAEAQYLHQLAQAMGLDRDEVNGIHGQLGVQGLYA
ncbi:DUF533 domain-containing protein [Paracoccus sp. p4-l81]|uniref:DUF533 domain-containing protein n=1 Tax=unclassified Paracoccus (in: a-proteobacteria) TaxID=2688777 RepID=UPI0035B9778C